MPLQLLYCTLSRDGALHNFPESQCHWNLLILSHGLLRMTATSEIWLQPLPIHFEYTILGVCNFYSTIGQDFVYRKWSGPLGLELSREQLES